MNKTTQRTKALNHKKDPDDHEIADFLLEPTTKAAHTISWYTEKDNLPSDTVAFIGSLQQKLKSRKKRSKDAEALLIAQAYTLDSIFNFLAQKAARIPYTDLAHIQAIDSLLRLGFKAQSQCRTTLESLCNINHPAPGAVVKQQNFAYQQQINNSVVSNSVQMRSKGSVTEHDVEIKNTTNELLEAKDGQECLDFRTPIKTSCNDSASETVGAINRPQNYRGQAESC